MDDTTITKQEALAAFGGNGAELARAFGLTRQAVSAWPDGPIPEGYALKLRFVLKPEVFGTHAPAANDDSIAAGAGQG